MILSGWSWSEGENVLFVWCHYLVETAESEGGRENVLLVWCHYLGGTAESEGGSVIKTADSWRV